MVEQLQQQVSNVEEDESSSGFEDRPAGDYNDSTDDEAKCSQTDYEEECPDDYDIGGYHPVNQGDVFDGRYYTLRKLGWGHFATVWLSFDTRDKIFTAIKIPKARPDFIEAANDEYQILMSMREGDPEHVGAQNVVQLLNDFKFYGVSKSLHFCMVFEVLGDNLLTLVRRFNTLNLNFVKVITRQLLQGLLFLHNECDIIHTDLKPENVVICLTENQLKNLAIEAYNSHSWQHKPRSMTSASSTKYREKYLEGLSNNARKRMRRNRRKHREKVLKFLESWGFDDIVLDENEHPEDADESETEDHIRPTCFYEELQNENIDALTNCQVKIIDFGNACYIDAHITDEIQTREYRSPEVILGTTYDTSADIWSAACIIYEIISGEYLFYPEASEDKDVCSDGDHLVKMMALLGPMPSNLFEDGQNYYEFFNDDGNLLRPDDSIQPSSMMDLLLDHADLSNAEAREMVEFLLPMLRYNIRQRSTANECLQSKWLKLSHIRETTKLKGRVNSEII